jgi:DNA ligase-1
MEFAEFAARADEVEEEPADLAITAAVADLVAIADDDLERVARFVQGRVFPAHDATKLDVGPSLCYEAIARAAGRNVSADDVEERLADVGEIGAVAESFDLGGQQGLGAFGDGGGADGHTVAEVDEELRAVAAAQGEGSEDEKRQRLFGLFNRAEPIEARFLARLVLGEMRVGVGEGTVRDAIAEAFEVPVEAVERAVQVSNDVGLVARVASEEGEDGLADVSLEVGRPVQAMLAQAGTVAEALEDWGEAVVEIKYDGARVQVHYDGRGVAVYSRNLEDVTGALPELGEFVEANVDVPAVIDGEAFAVADDGDPLPFQEVLKRFRRKHDVERMREEVRVELRAFDCLHADGVDLLDEALLDRHDRLRSVVPDDAVSDVLVSDDAEEIEGFEAAALEAGHEGVMLKDPGSAYTPGRRGKHWRKRKPDVETLDCVVTGAEWGEGRRAELFGTFELSVRDDDGYATVGNVATGITDEELADLTDRLRQYVVAEDGQDIEFEPAVVFEVGYEEIQPSPTYDSGYGLRFPRFLGVREDKDPADGDTVERVERLADRE